MLLGPNAARLARDARRGGPAATRSRASRALALSQPGPTRRLAGRSRPPSSPDARSCACRRAGSRFPTRRWRPASGRVHCWRPPSMVRTRSSSTGGPAFTPPGDPAALAAALDRLAESPDELTGDGPRAGARPQPVHPRRDGRARRPRSTRGPLPRADESRAHPQPPSRGSAARTASAHLAHSMRTSSRSACPPRRRHGPVPVWCPSPAALLEFDRGCVRRCGTAIFCALVRPGDVARRSWMALEADVILASRASSSRLRRRWHGYRGRASISATSPAASTTSRRCEATRRGATRIPYAALHAAESGSTATASRTPAAS